MPLLAIPTTLAQLQDAFRVAIEGMTPRTVSRSATSIWRWAPQIDRPSQGARFFRCEWDREGLTEGGFMWRGGASVDVTLSVIADYGGIPTHERDALAHDDHEQLADVLDAQRLTVNGLRRVRAAGWAEEYTDNPEATQIQIVHQFLVTYLQARAAS